MLRMMVEGERINPKFFKAVKNKKIR